MNLRMTDILHRILLSVLLVAGMSACSEQQDEPVQPGETEDLFLGFYINVGEIIGEEKLSRATPDGDYNRGEGYENYIDIDGKDFRIYFFSADNKYIASFEEPEIEPWEWGTSPFSKYYLARTNIRDKALIEQLTKGPTKIVMLANWRHKYLTELVPGETTIDDLVNTTIDYTEAWGPEIDYESRMPLYGVMQFDGMHLSNMMLNLAGDGMLHLLRAFAKIEIYDNPKTLEHITSVELTRHNSKAYCAPKKVYHQDDYVKNAYNLDYTLSPTVDLANDVIDGMTIPKRTSDGHFVIYVPEYKNKDRSNDNKAKLKVYYPGYADAFVVEFKYYNIPEGLEGSVTLDEDFDLLRNNWYMFELNKRPDDVEVDVVPYTGVSLNPDFGLDID